MLVVAGPPGSGKSTAFPGREMGLDWFNADDRAAELNGGSYRRIPPAIRAIVNSEFERFIEDHIVGRRSFACETTLRTAITIEQARKAKAHGFVTAMLFLAVSSVDEAIERVAIRVESGGHAIQTRILRQTYEASLANLPGAIQEFDHVRVYDTSGSGNLRLVLVSRSGRIQFLAEARPEWIVRAIEGIRDEGR
jgi:predicted ABC-type ATPase